MKTKYKQNLIVLCIFALLVGAGCAKTKVTGREPVAGLYPRPANIWVYDFAATPAEIPADSVFAGQFGRDATYQTAEHIETGRILGGRMAMELVKHIHKMGIPSIRAVPGAKPQINDVVLRGYIISYDEGDATKRVAIGLGSGASDLQVAVEGFQVTPQGLRLLGSGSSDADASKTPGMAVGAATLIATKNPAGLIVSTGVKLYGEKTGKSTIEGRVDDTAKEIAEILRKRFQGQGWI
jgi:hypothetical protein